MFKCGKMDINIIDCGAHRSRIIIECSKRRKAVSYTHLDVYKRQDIHKWKNRQIDRQTNVKQSSQN